MALQARAEYLHEMRNALRKLLDQLGIEPGLRGSCSRSTKPDEHHPPRIRRRGPRREHDDGLQRERGAVEVVEPRQVRERRDDGCA